MSLDPGNSHSDRQRTDGLSPAVGPSCRGFGQKVGIALFVVSAMTAGSAVCAEDFHDVLTHARELAERHRYPQVIEVLTPFSNSDDPEIRYVSSAEIGRAYFHLGQYHPANRAFREAVALRPERPETAIYFEATSYLTGDTNQAFLIFEELLRSGARDLYLAVTLPGKRRFLAEPEVQEALVRHAVPLDVDLREATTMGVFLGQDRDTVIEVLGATTEESDAKTLTAEAGPAVIWVFAFDDEQRLQEVVLHAGHLLDYTPYRIEFAGGIDWTATPAAAILAWGPPSSTLSGEDHSLLMTWNFENHHATIEFAGAGSNPPPGHPDGAAVIQAVRMRMGPPPS